MQALVWTGPGSMVLEDRAVPEPGPGEALVTVTAAGICGSDLHGYTGASGRRNPGIVMGHEVAATVSAVGPGVEPGLVGTDVVVFPLQACGACEWCLDGAEQLCPQRRYIGIEQDGGFAEALSVPARDLVPIPGALDPAVAALAEPAAVALHAVRRAPPLEGATVLITGAGPIGSLLARVASVEGRAARVINTETSPRRREVAAALGNEVIDPSMEGCLEDLGLGGGVDVVFEAVGIQPTFDSALAAVRTRGTIVLVAGWQTVALPLGRLVTREIETRGTFNFSRSEFEAALESLSTIDAALLVNDRVPLAEAPAAFARLAVDPGANVKTVIIP